MGTETRLAIKPTEIFSTAEDITLEFVGKNQHSWGNIDYKFEGGSERDFRVELRRHFYNQEVTFYFNNGQLDLIRSNTELFPGSPISVKRLIEYIPTKEEIPIFEKILLSSIRRVKKAEKDFQKKDKS